MSTNVPTSNQVARAMAVAVFCCLAASAPVADAQPGLSATIGGSLDWFEEGDDDGTRSTAAGRLGAEHWFSEERGNVFYSLDAGAYATPGDWSYWMHRAGLSYRLDLKPDDKAQVFFGISGEWRRNGEAWASANYQGIGAMANAELRPTSSTTLRLGYRLDSRRFSEITALNQVEHDGFASLLVNLPTRTTLIGELHLGLKSYEGEPVAVPVPEATYAVQESKGQGRGMGPGFRPSSPFVSGDGDRAQLVSGLVRLAQSLADRTGLSLQFAWRDAGGAVPPALVTTPAQFFDDGVYDDPFASDARSGRAALKHVFAGGALIEGSGYWQRRDYTAAVALDPAGLPLDSAELRKDRIWQGTARLTVPVLPKRTGSWALSLETGYNFTQHQSNDAFYNYTSHGIGAALSIAY